MDAVTSEINTLSLHDALPICGGGVPDAGGERDRARAGHAAARLRGRPARVDADGDRKSTRLNSSHTVTSYAVFCLKKKTRDGRACRDAPGNSRRTRDTRNLGT